MSGISSFGNQQTIASIGACCMYRCEACVTATVIIRQYQDMWLRVARGVAHGVCRVVRGAGGAVELDADEVAEDIFAGLDGEGGDLRPSKPEPVSKFYACVQFVQCRHPHTSLPGLAAYVLCCGSSGGLICNHGFAASSLYNHHTEQHCNFSAKHCNFSAGPLCSHHHGSTVI